MKPSPVDLFGEVVVTVDDVRAWLRAVPRLDPDSPRAPWYVATWRVVDKIKAAKLDGSFDAITAPVLREPAPWWSCRFSWRPQVSGAS